MDQQKITLSHQYEGGSGIELLMRQCWISESVNQIVIDFHRLRFIEIGSVALLLGLITSWKAREINVTIDANYNSDACRYLSRINFF